MTFRLCFAESKVKGAGWLGAESMNKRVMGGGDLTAEECDVCALMPVFVGVRVTSSLWTEFGERVRVYETRGVRGFRKAEWFCYTAVFFFPSVAAALPHQDKKDLGSKPITY